MTPRTLTFLLVVLCSTTGFFATKAEAQFGIRPNRTFDELRRQERRQLYRPNAHISRGPGGSRVFQSGASIPFEYRVRAGFVSKVEVRSGLKVIKTISINSSSGRGHFTLTSADFARAGISGKKLKFKLWGWQGRNSFQSIHGESISYTLAP